VTKTPTESRGGAGDLLSPTLQERGDMPDGPAPWRLGSQFYVAALGGSLAVTAIALLNARRHAMPQRARVGIAAIGLITFTAVLVVAALTTAGAGDDTPSGLRVAVQLVSVAGWGLMFLIQRPYDRVFEAFGDREYDSLWVLGLVAVILLGAVQLVAVLGVRGY